ncbi:MAG: helicase-related protein [Chthoniobacteraceae bacterium]
MTNTLPRPGQRWVSDSEPELGLGIILKAEFGRVELHFPAASEQRQYALKTAPLRRVKFKEGDRIKLHSGEQLTADRVEDRNGLLIYHCGAREVAEAELSDTISFSTPEERLLVGQTDELQSFELRVEALQRRCAMRKSPVRGYVGGRVDLLPHQMFIAGEVASRLVPRVLLADEVGLGKTIEAGLILHRLHLTGRAARVLIVVPEPLVHQWFIELLRRFNLLFSIFDAERCEAIAQGDAAVNPFLDSQLVLCGLNLLTDSAENARTVLDAGWDLLVVDEAHHLAWTPQVASPQYQLVEALARKTPGLLLLTATPQQLGPEGHFARLRLLDPDRYADLGAFLAEAGHYEQVAHAIDRLIDGKPLGKADREMFGEKSARIRQRCDELAAGDEAARARLVAELLDEFGTGRVMFRNTRATLHGFPKRKAELVPLDDSGDTKVKWLAALLRELRKAKVLLICRTKELAIDLHERLQREIAVAAALFHEDLTLLQRDRNAAFFAEEDGARILMCSEIGSEGRNFQFAHHLVLFDLPDDPELLEQRIGRLDRIGQTATIRIHVPFARGTGDEVLARWYHEGLNAFERNLHGATEIATSLAGDLSALRETFDPEKLTAFIAESRKLQARVTKKLERGHDRLLELNSCKPEQAAHIIDQVHTADADTDFEAFFVRLSDHFGVAVEEMAPRSYILRRGHLLTDAFSVPEDGQSITFDRTRALSRDDLGFMSWDHPMLRSALDLLLGSEQGNSAFGVWKGGGSEAIMIEAHLIAECVAPAALHADRFLPATPVRVVVDHALTEHTDDPAVAAAQLEKGDIFRLLDRGVVKKKLIPAMLAKAKELAAARMQALVSEAMTAMNAQLAHEIERLETLAELNDHVTPAEIAAARQQQTDLQFVLAATDLRLDSVRLIFRVP